MVTTAGGSDNASIASGKPGAFVHADIEPEMARNAWQVPLFCLLPLSKTDAFERAKLVLPFRGRRFLVNRPSADLAIPKILFLADSFLPRENFGLLADFLQICDFWHFRLDGLAVWTVKISELCWCSSVRRSFDGLK